MASHNDGKKDKTAADVKYGRGHPGRYCKDCHFFLPKLFVHPNACQLVAGLIDPLAWCKLFEPKTAPQGRRS